MGTGFLIGENGYDALKRNHLKVAAISEISKGNKVILMDDGEEYKSLLKSVGGEKITITHNSKGILNPLEVDKPDVTEELLREKEVQLRYILDEANKENMLGTEYAIEKLKDTSSLDAEPLWKEVAVKILEEYAAMRTK